jgi:hypothetical protein
LFRDGAEADGPPNTGYLLFEKGEGQQDLICAADLGANLHCRKVGLVILSACQSAAFGESRDEAGGEQDRKELLGSVAARLTAAGIPAVLAMTHSVLVATTRVLFGEFYKQLAKGKSPGEALDHARRHLHNHPEKYEVQRSGQRVWLKLHDWFIPALYQGGSDKPLLDRSHALRGNAAPDAPRPVPAATLPPRPEAGFFGRRRELWDIERGFSGPTRRLTLAGFGGQGKTALALEAGRWLVRTGLFRAAAFVSYSGFQGIDAVAVARNEIGAALGFTPDDTAAATKALRETPTLMILDNLESLEPAALKELLDAARDWSEAGGSRVLLTTRAPEFGHPAYRVEGTRVHRRIVLEGLGRRDRPDDALDWFAELWKLPPEQAVDEPKREALIELFDRVQLHPLSIRVLAAQLKTRRVAELGERLEELLKTLSPTPCMFFLEGCRENSKS